MEEIKPLLRELEEEVMEGISSELDRGAVRFEHDAELRYAGQKHSVRTSLPADLDVACIRQRFEEGYQARYGRVHADAPVELIMLRVSAVIAMPKPELQGLIGQGGAIAPE